MLASLTGLEIDSAKSGVRPNLDEYLKHRKVQRTSMDPPAACLLRSMSRADPGRSMCPDFLLLPLPGLLLLNQLEHRSVWKGADVLPRADHWPDAGGCLPLRPVGTAPPAHLSPVMSAATGSTQNYRPRHEIQRAAVEVMSAAALSCGGVCYVTTESIASPERLALVGQIEDRIDCAIYHRAIVVRNATGQVSRGCLSKLPLAWYDERDMRLHTIRKTSGSSFLSIQWN